MLKAKNRLGIIFFPAYDWAISPTHPERQERLLYTQDQLKEEGVFDIDGIGEYKPEVATVQDVERVHFCFPDVESVCTESHLISAGGAITAAKLVMEKKEDRAFALVRPPGHHAMKVVHGARGFCNINIEAVMVEYIREHYGQKRIAIVDTDCHHGDGSQDIYWNDPNTLYISIHQEPRTLFPGKGNVEEIGSGEGEGRNLCIPMPPGSNSHDYRYILENIMGPVAQSFSPDFYLVDVGFDGHRDDPLSSIRLDDEFFTWIAVEMMDLARSLTLILEGGYDLDALARCNRNLIQGLENYKTMKEEYEKGKEPIDNSMVNRETRKIYESLSDIFSPYFDI